ncbi:hypothetical protein QBC43DRAFT_318840 [Cladorrhinum sp. PSN259]|nr:hypothetical protein QBC43DRAFT_318840 [Cladorrhinum sp. PSN259]
MTDTARYKHFDCFPLICLSMSGRLAERALSSSPSPVLNSRNFSVFLRPPNLIFFAKETPMLKTMGLALYNKFSNPIKLSSSSSFLSSLEEEDTDLDSACQHYSASQYNHRTRRPGRSINFNSSFSDDESSQWSQDSTLSRDGRIPILPEGIESQPRARRPPSLERQDAFWDAKTVKKRRSGHAKKRGIEEESEDHHLEFYRATKRARRDISNNDMHDSNDTTWRKTWDMETERAEEHDDIIRTDNWMMEDIINRATIDDISLTYTKDDIKHSKGAIP